MDVHPSAKYGDFKKAIGASFSIFYWPQFLDRKDYLEAELVKSYLDGITFWGNRVLNKSTDETEKNVYPKFIALATAFVDFFKGEEKAFKWTGTEDISGMEAFFNQNTTADKIKDFSNVLSLGGGSGGAAPAQQAAPQKSSGGGSSSSGFTSALDEACPASKISALKDALGTYGCAQVTKATEDWLQCLQNQKAVLATKAKFKKPADGAFLVAPVLEASKAVNEVKQKDFKAPKYPIDSLSSAFNLFFWPSMDMAGALMDASDELLDQASFGINKTALGTDEKAKDWANSFKEVLAGFAGFLKTQADNGLLEWQGSEDPSGAEAFFKSQLGAAPASTQAPKVEEKKAPAPAPKPVAAAAKKPAPAAKPPLRKKVANKWNVENYENETITFTEDELGIAVGLVVFNCKNCTIILESKLQNITMINCKKTEVQIDRLIALCELVNCQASRIVGKEQLKSVSLEGCKDTKLVLNEKTRGCRVTLTCSKDTWIDAPMVSKDAEAPNANQPLADSFLAFLAPDSDEFTYEDVKGLE